MDHYHWQKPRPQSGRSPPPPSQSPPQPSPRTSAPPPAFLSQPLMPSTGFAPYPHPTHPPAPPAPSFHALQHSQGMRDSIVSRSHTFQNVQNPLGVPIPQHLPQLSSLHHRPLNPAAQQQHPPQVNPPQPLHMQHQPMQHPHPTHMSQPLQPPSRQQQQQQSSQKHIPPQHHRSHHQMHPPHQHPHHQSAPPQHNPQQQQQPSLTMQPPSRRISPPTLQSPPNRPLHTPHTRPGSTTNQHIPPQEPTNSQMSISQNRLPHLQPPNPQQQLPPRGLQQPSQQQQFNHPHVPPHLRRQSHEVKHVVYDSGPPYRLSQQQQPFYHSHTYSNPQPHTQSQPITQHSQMYSSIEMPSHEYQRQTPALSMQQDSIPPPLSQQRIPSSIHQPQAPQHQPPRQPSQQSQINQQTQQQSQQHLQQQQSHPAQKLVTPLQPQQMPLVQMTRSHGQPQQQPTSQLAQPPHQQQQRQQSQHAQPHHHIQSSNDQVQKQQSMQGAQQNPSHQLGRHQQQLQQTQSLPSASAQRLPLPERRAAPAQLHQQAQSQIHLSSSAIPTTLQMQHHGHQMQPRQVLPVQPLPPRDRAHPVPPLMGQQPKSSPSQPLPQQSSNQPPPQKLTQRTQSSQQASQPTKQQMAAHPQTSMQDNIQQGGPPGQRVANRPDTHPVNSSGLDRIPPKQESTIDQNVGRQLKVEDALAYLEQVKSQFSDRPSVYNNFLDIMKEFKAQTIDTAEVIRRVSSLFQGHRKLILGFNTFLPPGFRIELRGDPTKGCVTGFSSPGGVFFPLNGEELPPQPVPPLQRQPDMPPPQPSPMSIDASQHPPPQQHGPALPRHQAYPPSRDGHRPNQMAHPEAGFDQGAYHKPVVETEEKPQVATSVAPTQASPAISLVNNSKIKAQPVVSSNDNAAAALAGAFASPSTSAVVPGKPIEFEQAVTYVNKIKSRFSEDEDVYQTFLRILQTYQKDQKSIKEVQKQVSSLFQDHNDLLAGFSHFLPEQAPQLQRPNSSHTAADATSGRGRPQSSHVKQQPVLEGVVADGSSFPSSNWRGKDRPGKVPSSGRSKSGKSTVMTLGTNGGVAKSGSSARQKSSSAQDPKRIRRSASSGKKTSNDIKFGQLPPAMAGTAMVAGEAPTPELEFFEELRSQLGPEGQQSYSDFIKCLSLFSQEIICEDELMRLADGLLNNRKPLTDAFRAFLDQSDRKAAESAVFILRKAKSSGEGSSANGVAGKGHAAPPGINTQAVAENLKDLPLLTGISGPGSTGFNGGNKSPKINPLYSGKPLSEIGREYGTEIAESSSYMALPSDLGAIPCSGMSGKDRDVLNHMCISRGNVTGVPLIEYDQGPQPPNGSARRKAISRQHPPVTGRAGQGGSCGLTGNGSGSPRTVQNGYGVVTPLSIEDQRVELALIISQAENTIGKLERFRKGEIRSITSLSSLDLKPIELIYKDASCDILEVLRSNPVVTVPVIFERLEQRLLEWQVSRKKLERIWKSKRFCRKNEVIDAPRTWRRGELVGELKMLHEGLSLSKKEHKCDKGVNSEKGRKEKNMDNEDSECGKQADVGQSDKDTSKNDNYCGKDVDAGKEKKSVIGPRSKSMQRFLICEDKNLSLICDILWYAFEWEANCAEEADQGLEFLERTYYVLQKLEEDENRFYMDEHLYVYIRLISEASVRVNYVLEQRSERIEKLINGVKDVLGGMISLPMYDEICMKLFGESDEWEEVLGDLPLIFKRLAGSARKIWQRRNAKELLKLAEINVLGKGKAGKNDDGDVNMTEAAAGVSKEESENSSKRLRKAIMLTGETNGEVIEMQIEVESEVCKEDEVEEQTGLRNGGKRLVLSMRYVPRGTASQYERFNVKEEKVGYKDFDSALTKYIRRAVKRKRHRGYIETSGKDTAMDMIQVDGLDVRVDEEDGELRYVSGTEDFLVKAAFKRRRKMTRLSDLVQHQRQRSAVVVTMS